MKQLTIILVVVFSTIFNGSINAQLIIPKVSLHSQTIVINDKDTVQFNTNMLTYYSKLDISDKKLSKKQDSKSIFLLDEIDYDSESWIDWKIIPPIVLLIFLLIRYKLDDNKNY